MYFNKPQQKLKYTKGHFDSFRYNLTSHEKYTNAQQIYNKYTIDAQKCTNNTQQYTQFFLKTPQYNLISNNATPYTRIQHDTTWSMQPNTAQFSTIQPDTPVERGTSNSAISRPQLIGSTWGQLAKFLNRLILSLLEGRPEGTAKSLICGIYCGI